MKIVIIDDFRFARLELLALTVKHKDIEILGESENGQDAITLVRQVKPDVIFTDINMPGISVFEFLAQIDPAIHIIFTTAYADHAVKTFAFNTVD